MLRRLNYHHLFYFWTVAREGSVTKASEHLRVAQPSVSSQLGDLEGALGYKLFERKGRRLVLTEAGRTAYRYADQIFTLGRELQDALQSSEPEVPLRLVVGLSQVIPKLVAERLLQPALAVAPEVHLVCREGRLADLLAALALHQVDVVLADQPADRNVRVRAYSHLLGEGGESFFGADRFLGLREGFPRSLDRAPMLLQGEGTAVRRDLEQWFDTLGVRPRVLGEFEDSALMQAFGQQGKGVFAAPTVIEADVVRAFGVGVIGRTEEVRERFYAISLERRLRHPAVVALAESARRAMVGTPAEGAGG
jgi:LysR family transcriptional regulator, transcriptional activator of nhaA